MTKSMTFGLEPDRLQSDNFWKASRFSIQMFNRVPHVNATVLTLAGQNPLPPENVPCLTTLVSGDGQTERKLARSKAVIHYSSWVSRNHCGM